MESAERALGLRDLLRRGVYVFGVVLVFTSLIDLLVNRLLFRAGPEALSHIQLSIVSDLAVVGRVSMTLEQLLLFVVVGSATLLLLYERRLLQRLLGALLIPLAVCSALLYSPLSGAQAWAVSTLLILVTAITVFGLAWLRASARKDLSPRQRLCLQGFLLLLVLSFVFPLYYRTYLLVGAVGLASLPFGMAAYQAGIYSVMGTTLALFAYALIVPSPGFALNYRNFAKAAVLPTLLIVPMLFGLMRNFFALQIFSMVVAMSTDFVLSFDLVRALILLWWFFLTAVLLLLLKGHYSSNKFLVQQGVGLILILSTTFLFNYPYYLMLGTVGVLLLSYPLLQDSARNS